MNEHDVAQGLHGIFHEVGVAELATQRQRLLIKYLAGLRTGHGVVL